MHIGFGWECQKKRVRYENQDIDGWTILKWILETYDGLEKDRTDLAQDGVQWRALVNTVMNFRVP
jgi:hypothetical protein